MSDAPPLRPGMIVGILGGGQLGRMLAIGRGRTRPLLPHLLPRPEEPGLRRGRGAHHRALRRRIGARRLRRRRSTSSPSSSRTFRWRRCASSTARVAVFPGSARSKSPRTASPRSGLIAGLGIPVAPFAEVSKQADIYSALARTGRPAILKTRRLGYDGKGQALIRAGDDPVARLAGRSARPPAILEALHRRSSARSRSILARGRDGAMRAFDVDRERPRGRHPRDEHGAGSDHRRRRRRGGRHRRRGSPTRSAMSASSRSRCSSPPAAPVRGSSSTRSPRASTIPATGRSDAALCSQFEQHIRAIAGWPLGDPARHSRRGDDQPDRRRRRRAGRRCSPSRASGCISTARPRPAPGRKMGHCQPPHGPRGNSALELLTRRAVSVNSAIARCCW